MQKKSQFQLGTIVKLNSGGPDMTVRDVCINYDTNLPSGIVGCQWFAGKKLESGHFPVESLGLAPQTQDNK